MSLIKMPSIEQFRNVIKQVGYRTNYDGIDAETGKAKFVPRTQPKLKYRGTVKLHGTNAAIVMRRDAEGYPVLSYQSKERVLTLEQDNAGFMLYMSAQTHNVARLFGAIQNAAGVVDTEFEPITVYGEWAGGNIQSSVAINGLEKFFAVFAVRLGEGDDARWMDIEKIKDAEYPNSRIFNILTFGKWETEIDFERPLESQNHLGELTLEVEESCPAGKFFGNDGIGEGIVWACITPGWESSDYWMKVKGEKHSGSKVKKLATVDTEAIRAISDFVDYAVTESRLVQGAQNLVREQGLAFEMANMGPFIKWVYGDVIKEETDTIVANQLDPKKLGGPVANKARAWFVTKFNEGVDFSA
jgi:hypothetical protein